MASQEQTRRPWNGCRYQLGSVAGHYESYFQRANHPDRPLAFWVRYTNFVPANRPDQALGELWAIYFDGEAGTITAVKREEPLSRCRFSPEKIDVSVAGATLNHESLEGAASHRGHEIRWNLRYEGDAPPLLLLPENLYAGGFPKAKALVGTPNAIYHGSLFVDGVEKSIDGWVGSQNHNWGSKHTDLYAWGQVAGFDGVPDSFLECGSAKLKFGPIWTPMITVIVLRLGEESFKLNGLLRAVRAKGVFDFFDWRFSSERRGVSVDGRIWAPKSAFVGLTYYNPPGGTKTCLNSKLASCELTLRRPGHEPLKLRSQHRAAFEILTDDTDHGVPIVA